jgi:hypothetical protein
MRANHESFARPFSSWLSRAAVAGWVMTALSGSAFAYRPFDGTDAAVAKPGDVEIELASARRRSA